MASDPRYALEEGRTYLVRDPKVATEAFSELGRDGRQSLLITNSSAEDVLRDFSPGPTLLRLLGDSSGAGAIAMGDLLGVSLTIKEFMQEGMNPIVMISCVDALAKYNGFTPVLRLLQGLDETTATRRGILILCAPPGSLTPKEEALLISETVPMPEASR